MLPLPPDISSLESILRQHLVNEVSKHLHKLIDEDIKEIAKDAVVSFMEIEINRASDLGSMRDNYYFNFVQKITKTVIRETVIKEKENK